MKLGKIDISNQIRFIFMVMFLIAPLVQAETIEIVIFNTKESVSAEQLIKSAQNMRTTLATWEGYQSRELVDLGEGKWADVVHWDNMESATLAQEKAMKSEVCLSFFALIDDQQQQFYHGNISLKQTQ